MQPPGEPWQTKSKGQGAKGVNLMKPACRSRKWPYNQGKVSTKVFYRIMVYKLQGR